MRYSSAGSLELLPPGFVVNDLGDDPALLAAFDLLMRVPKAAQDTESSAGRDRAVCLLLEALDRAYALKRLRRLFQRVGLRPRHPRFAIMDDKVAPANSWWSARSGKRQTEVWRRPLGFAPR